MFDTPLIRYRPTRVENNFGSTLSFDSSVSVWGDVERNTSGVLEIQVNVDEDIKVGDVLVLDT